MTDPTNESIIGELNARNGVSEKERKSTIEWLLTATSTPIQNLILKSIASMNQDVRPSEAPLKPAPPEISYEPIPQKIDIHAGIAAIGGMAAYLNAMVHGAKKGDRYCVITHPNDIFTYAAWTLHPEEDMDQRLVPMFRTPSLVVNELKRFLRIAAQPKALRFKAFKIDYAGALHMLFENPKELLKLIRVNFRYILGELFQEAEHHALTNLKRNRFTLKAFKDLNRIGNRPHHDFLNMPGRVVFENTAEPSYYLKRRLKSQFGLEEKYIPEEELWKIYGARLPIAEDIANGVLKPALYKGGYFWAGFKENALNAAMEMGARVFENATATRISIDEQASKCAVRVMVGKEKKTVVADTVITAIGNYGENIISVDGVSILFVIRTESPKYNLFPTGMGEGGTIHIVPVGSLKKIENKKTLYYHLGKATNGAVVGRDPRYPKRISKDIDFLLHIETHLRRILPADADLIWITATECGRPVVAGQGYRVTTLAQQPLVIDIAGGCGLGGNTPIIPEVQQALEKRNAIS